MRAFSYIAFTAEGRRRRGTVVAESAKAAERQLAQEGLFPSSLTPQADTPIGQRRWFSAPHIRRQLSADFQAVFTRQMSVLLEANLPLDAALGAVQISSKGTALEHIAARAKAQVMDGQSLAEALRQSGAGFAQYYIAAVEAGEVAGNLNLVFAELARHLEEQGQDRAQISSALLYPAFVAVVSIVVCAILMTTVAPEIVAMFEISGRPLPPLTRVMLNISDWIRDNAALLGLLALGGGVGVLITARLPKTRQSWMRIGLRLPVFGRLIRLSAAVQYLRTLALVLSSRHAVLNAVQSAGNVLSVIQFQRESDAAVEAIRTGSSLADALTGLSFLPPVAHQLIRAGEQSSNLAKMADRSARLVESGLVTERKRIGILLEPILMMMVGGMVLTIVLSVLLPIFDLQSVISQ